MQRALAQAALPNFRAQQAVTGDQIANTQDVVPTGPANVMAHVVNFTGGRRPSNLGPNARSAGAALSGIGASNIGKDVLPAVPSMPKLSDGGGALGNALGGGSLLSSLLGALGGGGKGGSGFDIGKLLSGLKGGYHTTVDSFICATSLPPSQAIRDQTSAGLMWVSNTASRPIRVVARARVQALKG